MKKFLTLTLAMLMLLCCALPASAADHGTTDQTITEDMLNNTPPANYTVNSATQGKAREGVYNAFFLKDDLQTVQITIDENNFNYLLQNALEEPYVMTQSVTIGGTTLGYCGLKTKGNFTLEHAFYDNPGSDRFSFTVNFGKYITQEAYGEKQNFYGCKKISFNNFFFDKSMMKEYCALMLMQEMGLPTPQFGLAKLYINGAYYGVYFMVETYEDTILQQYWNVGGKDLTSYFVKPVGTNLNYDQLLRDDSPLYEKDPDTQADVADMLPTVMDWSRKLTNLSNGKDFEGNAIDVQSGEYVALVEQILELEEVLKYFAVSSWLCQLDNMFVNSQNFGLYVSQEGRATLLPWDYDLSFGCYYPSTAQNTANYPVDVMYRLDYFGADEAQQSARVYKDFPLFHVIYQNEELMTRYRSYMAECSQIAALGGTVASTGKSYAPAYLNGCIETLSEALIAAATEETADNVYYMNGIRQPKDVEAALPNLSAIIALRAVGVWSQVYGEGTTVCGSGCNLETLGNALLGEFENAGRLITVDRTTGIFTAGQYDGGRRKAPPSLKVIGPDEATMTKISQALGAADSDTVRSWILSSTTVAQGGYTVTIPLGPEFLAEGANLQFYTWANGALTALTVTREGNLFSFEADKLGTVVLHATGVTEGQTPNAALPGGTENDDSGIWILTGIIAAVAAAATGVIVLLKKKKAKNPSL